PDFVEALPRFFGAFQEELDMRNDPEGARRYVNAWVASRTDDLIKELLGEGAFNDRSQLALVNALYFKAAWATPFKDSFTEDADFTLLDGSTVTVDMMHAPQFAGRATQGSDYVAIDLPYANANMSMTVIVPDEGAFSEVHSRIGAEFTAEVDAEISAGMV